MRIMKKAISLVLALVCVISCAVTAAAYTKGDVDRDGGIAAADARIALRYSVALETLVEEQIKLADYNVDGKVTAADARCILRVSVGLSPELPVLPEIPEYPEPEKYVPNERELKFYDTVYNISHPLLNKTKPNYPTNFQKWCCEYTIKDVFRPALEAAGYPESRIDLLAPTTFPNETVSKAIGNLTGLGWPTWLVVNNLVMVPSFLCDYYIDTPAAAEVFFLTDFYDDVVECKVYEHDDEDRAVYRPRIGDILFISNKTKTYENGYPTVDHTAQITKIYEDGTFLCTEGSLVYAYEGDNRARVRERRYKYNEATGTYEYMNNPLVVALMIAQPKLA